MPVINILINEVKGERKKTPVGNINIRSTPTIKNIEEKNFDLKGIDKVLSIEFEFKTEYEPKIGFIQLSGDLIYAGADNKEVLKKWKKNKKIDEKIGIEVINSIFRRCIIKAVALAEDLQLPPPLQIPRFTPATGSEYIG